jgi:hypothetical protein
MDGCSLRTGGADQNLQWVVPTGLYRSAGVVMCAIDGTVRHGIDNRLADEIRPHPLLPCLTGRTATMPPIGVAIEWE